MSRLQVVVSVVLGVAIAAAASLWVWWVYTGAQADREMAAQCFERHTAGRERCACLEVAELRSGGNGHVAAARARACEGLEVVR